LFPTLRWLGLSEQLRAIDEWNPARFLVSV
jgi:hypothetical protein